LRHETQHPQSQLWSLLGFTFVQPNLQIWKGKKQSRIIVYTSDSMCGSRFVEGDEYLVFSHTYKNKEYTSVCSRTSNLEHFNQAEIRTLGKGRIVR
jgi:hypothetical protein